MCLTSQKTQKYEHREENNTELKLQEEEEKHI